MSERFTPGEPPSFLHVEHNPSWVVYVDEIVRRQSSVRSAGNARSSAETRARCMQNTPSVLLIDTYLPDGDAIVFAQELKQRYPAAKILISTPRCDEVILFRFHRSQLNGILQKDPILSLTLPLAVDTVLKNQRYISPELAESWRKLRMDSFAWFKLLSDRELELVPLFGRGRSDCEIAALTGLSVNTAHVHRTNIMRKLGLRRSVELIEWAHRVGFAIRV